MNPKDILETVIPNNLQERPELLSEINAVLQFVITGDEGGTWTVDLTKADNWVTSGITGSPKMTITCSDADFKKIYEKKLNPQQAAMQGKMKHKPMNMSLSMKVSSLFT